jgi:hypothetical protein
MLPFPEAEPFGFRLEPNILSFFGAGVEAPVFRLTNIITYCIHD